MDIRKLQRAIVDGLEDVKAQDIVVFNTEHLSPLFERVIVASGTSNRQTRALASSVREAVKSAGLKVLATEGANNAEWIIVDCGAAVAHIMQPQIRDYYRLEEIWGGKPVRMKLGDGAKKPLPKALAPLDEPPLPAAAKKVPAKKAAARKMATAAPARSAPAKAAPAPARRSAPRKAAAGKKAPQGTAPRKTAPRKAARGRG